ncbi:MAG: aryl-sulfate sulfotransferase [Polyangiaceae bacterium]|nr:aryl-sulfate sulfotransferase [Polyangiaceae bacterium]
MFAGLTLAGCSSDKPPASLVLDAHIYQNPNPTVPLAAILHIKTDEPTTVHIQVSGTAHPVHADFRASTTVHDIPVIGLAPGKTNSIVVTVESAARRKETTTLTFDAPALPADFPPLEILTSDPVSMEPGWTLFNVFQFDPQHAGVVVPMGWLVIVNAAGEVVWYHRPPVVPGEARQLSNGHLLYEYSHLGLVEIDMLGNAVAQWQAAALKTPVLPGATPVDTATMHHDMAQMPNGHFLTLSTTAVMMSHYPTSEIDPEAPPGKATVIVDNVVEFDRKGTIVRTWDMSDMLDLKRIGYDSSSPFWDVFYPGHAGGTKDWSHANGIAYSEEDDSIVVSLRNQDAIVKFSRETGKLAWIFAPPANWKSPWQELLLSPASQLEWPYHQHAPKLGPNGKLLLFDNGNCRASPFEVRVPAEQNHSRVVEFRIDEAAKTVTQEWSYGGSDTEIFYSPFLGEGDWMPTTGNILVADGGHVVDEHGTPSDSIILGHKWARIFEVTREDKPRKVFEIRIKAANTAGFGGWSIYRAERIPHLYP